MTVWLAWQNTPWQGDTLLGIYSTPLAAQARIEQARTERDNTHCDDHALNHALNVEEITIDTDVTSWHGN